MSTEDFLANTRRLIQRGSEDSGDSLEALWWQVTERHEEMREPCGTCRWGAGRGDCPDCHGLGYTPKRELGALFLVIQGSSLHWEFTCHRGIADNDKSPLFIMTIYLPGTLGAQGHTPEVSYRSNDPAQVLLRAWQAAKEEKDG